MKIAVIGGGYVGLISGACLADVGHSVIIVEQDCNKVSLINSARSPIHEDGLDELIRRNIGTNLIATDQLEQAVLASDVTIIAVGTPYKDDAIDLSQVESATRSIAEALRLKSSYHLVVVKSTVTPGTTDDFVAPLLEQYSGRSLGSALGIAMNPEFLREGSAVEDFTKPDRIVMGANDERALDRLAELYTSFDTNDKLRVNNRTAEMIKYAANSLLATLISYSNEMGNLCSTLAQVDIENVLHGVKLDKRFSPIQEDGQRIMPEISSYLAAGCGFGGSCFPKDLKALSAFAKQQSMPTPVLDAVIETNTTQPKQLLALLEKHKIPLENSKIAILGLAFKPGTDDVRESPALMVIRELATAGANVAAYDPIATANAKLALAGLSIDYAASMEQVVSDASAVILITAWPEFRELAQHLNRKNQNPLVIDGRRFLCADDFEFYDGIGLGQSKPNGRGKHNSNVSSAA